MKTVLKVVYVIYGFVILLMVGFNCYSSYNSQKIIDETNNYIKQNNFAKIGKIYVDVFENNNLVENPKDGNLNIAVLPSLAGANVDYDITSTDADGNKTTEEVEKVLFGRSYLFMMYNLDFSIDNQVDKDGNKINLAAIRFYNNTYNKDVDDSTSKNYYDYHFIQTEDINNYEVIENRTDFMNGSYYTENYSSDSDFILHSSYNYLNWYDAYNVLFLNLNQQMLEAIGNEIEGAISGFSIIKGDGDTVYSYEMSFDFSQGKLFTNEDTQKLIDLYNEYNYASDDEKDDKLDVFDDYYGSESKEGTFKYTHKDDYCFRHGQSYYYPSSSKWKALGLCALLLICLIIIYIVLFHFKAVKRLFSKDVTVQPSKKDRYSAKENAEKREETVKNKSKDSKWSPTDNNKSANDENISANSNVDTNENSDLESQKDDNKENNN